MQPNVSFDEMSLDERILYVQSLWDRIAEDAALVRISPEVHAELDRRFAAYQADPSAVLTWPEVEASVRTDRRG